MTINEILQKCIEESVELRVVDEQLEVLFDDSPSDLLIQSLRENKEALIGYLSENERSEFSSIERLGSKSAPLSHSQRRLWFIDKLNGGSSEYNLSTGLEVQGKVDEKVVEIAISQIILKHEILRTVYDKDEQRQYIREFSGFDLTILDYSCFSKEEQAEKLSSIIREESEKAFDLSDEVMLRATLIKQGEERSVFLFTVHHIACDGWSIGILVKEFVENYKLAIECRRASADSHQANKESKKTELAIQYSDYAIWQSENGEFFEEEIGYWLSTLQDQPAEVSLPFDFSRPKVQDFNANSVVTILDKQRLTSIKELCGQNGVTLFMMLYSVFSILIGRWSGNKDVIIGTPIAGRTEDSLNDLIGFFTNNLALRSNVDGESSFLDFLAENKKNLLEAYKHQTAPFEIIVDRLQPDRNLSHSPIFQILFSLHSEHKPNFDVDGLTIREADLFEDKAKFDLELAINEIDDSVQLKWIYATSLFKRSTIERVAQSFSILVDQIIESQSCALSSYQIVPPSDLGIIQKYSDNQLVNTGITKSILGRIREIVDLTPESIALTCGTDALTYRELDRRSNQAAHMLQAKAIGQGSIVALAVERSIEMVVGLIGILKAGAAYLPLEKDYPQERLNYMLDDCEACLTLESNDLAQENLACFNDSANGLPEINPEQPAYIIYTSGTTGKPKGVLINHTNMSHFIDAMQDLMANNNGVWLAVTGISFDISVLEIFGALAYGFRVVIAQTQFLTVDKRPENLSKELDRVKSISELICEHSVTHIQCTPSFAMMHLVDLGNADELASLQKIYVGGEKFPINLAQNLGNLTSAEIYNMYGPTEATVWSTFHKLERFDGECPIGKPLPGYQVRILDENKSLLPLGVIGEIYVSGKAVSSGYLNRPRLNQERFHIDPVIQNCRMYATGDLGRWNNNGELEIIGRKDQQIKIRGHRIECGEIEHQIQLTGMVFQAAVAAKELQPGDARIVAYIVLKDISEGFEQLVGEIKSTISKFLPDYMIPSHFVKLETLPKTQNGKIDKKALPLPLFSDFQSKGKEPSTELENLVARLWLDVLGTKDRKITLESNFFSLGGHSLLLTKLLLALNSHFQLELSLRDIFENSTFVDQVSLIEKALNAESEIEKNGVPGSKKGKSQIIVKRNLTTAPLSFSQKRLWFIDKLNNGSAEYNLATAFRVRGEFDVEIAQQALSKIIERHQILRTVYLDDGENTFQSVIDNFEFQIDLHDLTHLVGKEQEFRINELIEYDSNLTFDLSTDVMMRVGYLLINNIQQAQEGVLLFNVHHIAADGWSFAILLNEFTELYEAIRLERTAILPQLPVQYVDFSHWQNEWDVNEKLAGQIQYWKHQLSDLPLTHSLPLNFERPAEKKFKGKMYKQTLSHDLSSQLKDFAGKNDVSLFMMMHACLAFVIGKYSRSNDIVIGTPIAGRTQKELESLIGFFVNTLVLRTSTNFESFADLLSHVREVNLSAHANQDVPFEYLVENLGVSRNAQHSPLFQIMLTMNIKEGSGLSLPGVTFEPEPFTELVAKFDIEVVIQESDEGMFVGWIYDESIFSEDFIARLHCYMENMLDSVSSCNDVGLNELELLPEQEKQYLVEIFNKTDRYFEEELLSHQLFEAQAEKNPEHTAVIFEGQKLTYGELNRAANRLARYLLLTGVESDSFVGIYLQRSIDMVVSILGILKTGAAYVPIDPSVPKTRLDYVVGDTELKSLLTSQNLSSGIGDIAGCSIVELDSEQFRASLQNLSGDNIKQNAHLTSRSLAYVIYTSGSTGQPKGVMVEHQALVNRIQWMQNEYQLSSSDNVLQKTPYTFDVSVWEFIWTLGFGATLVIAKPEGHKDPLYLGQLIDAEKVTVMHFVPSMLNAFIHTEGAEFAASVRYIFCSGEALGVNEVKQVQLDYPGIAIHNLYGPTEAAIDVSYYDCKNLGSASTVPIGKPIQNIQLYILDDNLKLCPRGGIGQLFIGGTGLARGYLNKAELSTEKFISNTINPAVSSKLYATGDLARLSDDGNLIYLGRIDSQVKLRGFRIELGEVSYHLETSHRVARAYTTLNQSKDKLVAYIVPESTSVSEPGASDKSLTEGELVRQLRSQLSAQLPEYMVPAYFVVLQELPLTVNGKVDVKNLPQPDSAALAQDSFVAPQTSEQIAACKIWQAELGLEQVGITDDYFLLGGDSISALRLVSKMNAAIGCHIQIKDLFLNPTIEGLFSSSQVEEGSNLQNALTEGHGLIEQLQQDGHMVLSTHPNLAQSVEDFYPLSPIQRGMVFLVQMRPDEPIYHDQFTFVLSWQDFDQGLFQRAVDQVCQQHPILRTTFDLDNFNEPMQLVHRGLTQRVRFEDITELTDAAKSEYIEGYCEQDKAHKFLQGGELLWRLAVFQLNDTEFCMVLSFQHAILDGWSVNVLNSALVDTYEQLKKEDSVQVEQGRSQYKDYVALQLSRQVSADTQSYWQNYLQGYERSKLPFNFSGRPINDEKGMNTCYAQVDESLYQALQQRAHELGCTLKELCLSAHIYLLSLLSFDKEIVTGVVTHDRPALPDSELILGCFLNTIPLRMEANKQVKVKSLVGQVRDYLREVKAHEIFLAEIAGLVDGGDGGVNPIFDTLFNFTDFSQYDSISQSLSDKPQVDSELEVSSSEMTNTLFDMEVHHASSQRLRLQLKYSPAYFYPTEIDSALELYQNILHYLAAGDETLDAELLVDKKERHQLLQAFNQTEQSYPQDVLLHQLFEEQVTKTPNAIAIKRRNLSLSYLALNQKANRLAHWLVDQGIQPGDHVGFVAQRSPDLVVGLLAILKAGGVYVPMEPDYPKARQQAIIDSAEIVAVLTDEVIQDSCDKMLVMDDAELADYPEHNLTSSRRAQSLAYVIYTSGSTGTPKGVMIAHHSAVNLIQWVNQTYQIGVSDKLLFITSMCFDLSVYDMFGMLASGGCIVMASQTEVQDPSRLAALLVKEQITFWDSVPATMNHLVSYLDEDNQWELEQLQHLRLVFMSGDWIPVNLPARIQTYFKQAEIISLGGATEGTVWSNYYPVDTAINYRNSIPYGKPLSNNRFYILDDEQKPQPKGVAGHLYIGGVGVAEGYMNDPQKTAAAFYDDPFVDKGADGQLARMYKTGDIGRMLPDWNMEFLGREDHQVKLRGFRIELGEIEAVLSRHESIKQAVVNIHKPKDSTVTSGNEVLVGYLVPVAGEEIQVNALKAYLSEHLPAYMVPTSFMTLSKIPLTRNDKVDRKALPEPHIQLINNEFVGAESTNEKIVVNILARLLGEDEAQISLNDNFFEIGGHSLLAVKLVSEIRNHFSIELPISDVFEAQSVLQLVERIERCEIVTTRKAISAIKRETNYFPLSSSQQRLWFIDRMESGSPQYNMLNGFCVEGLINIDFVEQAIGYIIGKHESLRTVFFESEKGSFQRVQEDFSFKVERYDFSELDETEERERLNSLVESERTKVFDLTKDLMIRVTSIKLKSKSSFERTILLFNMHHIASDGWSMGILVKEFVETYQAIADGKPISEKPLDIQYIDYAVSQRETLTEKSVQRQLEYWKNQLADIPLTHSIPLDFERTDEQQFNGKLVTTKLRSEYARKISSTANSLGVTPFVLVHAVLALVVSRNSNQDDIVIGTPFANRLQAELEPLIGFFVNTIVLRTKTDYKDFLSYLDNVKRVNSEAQANQDLPFEYLVESNNVHRSANYSPLFQIMLTMNTNYEYRLELPGLKFKSLEGVKVSTKFDLEVAVDISESGVEINWIYNDSIFNSSTVSRLANHFICGLESVVDNPSRRISEISMLSPKESKQLIERSQFKVEAHAPREMLHEIFESRVEKFPDREAVKFENESMTYRQLNESANQQAYYLRELGVDEESLVGICLERSVDMIVAILAILKAGGAYVPIDPNYPNSRIDYILQDSEVEFVISTNQLNNKLSLKDKVKVISVDEESFVAAIARLSKDNLSGELTRSTERLAYVIYTSGSSGKPKGVMVEHLNVSRLFTSTNRQFGFSHNDIWTLYHSFAFDFSVWEIWGALLYGGKLIIVPHWVTRSFEDFYKLVTVESVTVLNQTPSAFNQFIEIDKKLQSKLNLKHVIFGGEAIRLSALKPWVELHGDKQPRLINMYGITETTVHVTYRRLLRDDIERNTALSLIGEPIDDLSIYLLTQQQTLTPDGVIGEIYVGGPGVARGYLHREQLTNDRFIQSPFDPKQRLYRSGDLARYNRAGELCYEGRADFQIKLRGFRIELGEIESALLAQDLQECCVVLNSKLKNLVAYIVPESTSVSEPGASDKSLTEGELVRQLRSQLSAQLPEYMVPAYFVVLQELPLTVNGKVDVKNLPHPDSAALVQDSFVAPQTSEQIAACKIWQAELGLEQVGITDDYFLLGGDSISALRLVSKMNAAIGCHIQIKDLFLNPTIEGLFSSSQVEEGSNLQNALTEGHGLIEQLQQDGHMVLSTHPNLAQSVEDFYPLSPIQRGMVFLVQMRPDEPIYHDQFTFVLSWQDFDQGLFQRAVDQVCQQHPILRTTFDLDNFNEPMQLVHRGLTQRVRFEDITELTDAAKSEYIEGYCEQDKAHKFLQGGELLWRLAVFQLNDTEFCMVLSFQHAILDGWSVNVLNSALVDTYEQLKKEDSVQVEQGRSQYKDYVALQLSRQVSADTQSYWQNYLQGYERSKLPFNFSGRPINDEKGMNTCYAQVDESLYQALQQRAHELGCTLKELCLSAHIYLLSLLSFDKEIVTGVVTHDRPALPDSELILGCFLNTIPLRMEANKQVKVKSLVGQVRDYLREVKAHEIFLAEIAGLVDGGDGGVNPIFDTLFNFTDFSQYDSISQSLSDKPQVDSELEVSSSEMTNTLFDMEVHHASSQRLRLQLKYSPAYFYPTEIDSALELYQNILHYLAAGDETLDAELLVDKKERHQLLQAFNQTEQSYPQDVLLHQLFEEQVTKTPNAIAIKRRNLSLSYLALNQKANRLAHWLVDQGIQPGDHVGFVAQRSPDLVVGLLAILKAGGVYVPMEPDYPKARQQAIIDSAEIVAVLTDEVIQDSCDKMLVMDDAELADYPEHNLTSSRRAQSLAYVIYTSGSTGTPKGVMIAHHSAVNLIQWVNQTYQIGVSDKLLFITSMCFDLSVYDMFGMLASGGCIVMASQTEVQDPSRLAALLVKEQITFWDSVPATMNHLVSYLDEDNQWELEQLQHLRLVFMSGDWIPVNLPARIQTYFKQAEIISLGGATEGTVWSNYYPVDTAINYRNSIPYGKPLSNNRFYILDDEQKPQPKGVAGHLYIGGVGVAEGYMNDPQKTAAAFYDDPFVDKGADGQLARMYKTGDIGRMLPDWNMEFLGREDHQVKLRGFRIELGEIEAVLSRHESIKQAVVNIHKPKDSTVTSGNEVLVGYLVPVAGEEIQVNALKAYLSEHLPAYMVPTSFMTLSKIPLTRNDKVDRKALPEPKGQSLLTDELIQPNTETETKLHSIWKELLELESISTHDNFFSIGGHSLLATRLVTEIRQSFGTDIPLRVLFEQATIKELATYLDENQLLKVAAQDISDESKGKEEKWII
ncbi:non-ribosomal peptide synthetase [Aliikangiella sp. G2MR2-5]|uniref:non-ribosomal peptide synthetase n=1 Tax=Aliikangiella sp. G2MR2-5 TaxID=2788943 RepID=UPI0018A9B9B5|nr:non-ribosomal peptide synthetase [Aliikangiella sp. G2MR2-5]